MFCGGYGVLGWICISDMVFSTTLICSLTWRGPFLKSVKGYSRGAGRVVTLMDFAVSSWTSHKIRVASSGIVPQEILA